ncbi:zinc-ribbon domain-containing protein [Halorubrum sp. Ea8]|uniref:zinc-ribbon domain-containing protein n=1 Tax=Halorubrum sp. Ea8 TaxID=1383841 RepID=UPI0011404467|nr:zinc ribbon domain-containing protein [Halorubrum sp. Ea8]
MAEDTPRGIDDAEEDSESPANENTPKKSRLDKDILRIVVLFGSMGLGAVLGLGFLIRGNLIMAGISFLIASGIPVLMATLEKSLHENKPSSTTKECPECGWHNHQANNNCVDCGETFPDRADHQQTNRSKYICRNCGWQNPQGNNYCIDCGEVINE